MLPTRQEWEPVVLRRAPPPAPPPPKKDRAEPDGLPAPAVPLVGFGNRVAEVRLRRGIRTQAKLAALVSEPVAVIAAIESGKSAPQVVVTKINAALGLFKTADFLRPPK